MGNVKKASYAKLKKDFDSVTSMIVHQYKKPKKIVSLQGLLKNVVIDEEDFKKARKSLFDFGA